MRSCQLGQIDSSKVSSSEVKKGQGRVGRSVQVRSLRSGQIGQVMFGRSGQVASNQVRSGQSSWSGQVRSGMLG